MSQVGLLIYIMVDSVAATVETVKAQGCEIVQPIGADAPEITARFSRSSGNVLALYSNRIVPAKARRWLPKPRGDLGRVAPIGCHRSRIHWAFTVSQPWRRRWSTMM